MITLATVSQKGGVGKTTVCINLGHALARRGWKTLLVDTDPQGGIGLSLSKSTRTKRGFYDFLAYGGEIAPYILRTRLPEFSVLPCGESLQEFERLQSTQTALAMKTLISQAESLGYDLVIFDTCAGMPPLNHVVMQSCDWTLIPQQAEPLALRSLPALLETLSRFKKEGYKTRVAGILLTMLSEAQETSQRVASELREMLPPALLCQQVVPRDALFLEASALGLPINLIRKNPPAVSLVFDHLAVELEKKMGIVQSSPPLNHESLLD